MALNPLPLYGM
ncbi:hypothetical protein YPPY76_1208, partial [Yersinia pestis PY-76]